MAERQDSDDIRNVFIPDIIVVSDMQIFSRIRVLAAAGQIEIIRDAPSYREMRIRKTRD